MKCQARKSSARLAEWRRGSTGAAGTAKVDMVELFPGAAQVYRAYLQQFGATFSEGWLAYPEWQVLLPQALEKNYPITDTAIHAYMTAFRLNTARREE